MSHDDAQQQSEWNPMADDSRARMREALADKLWRISQYQNVLVCPIKQSGAASACLSGLCLLAWLSLGNSGNRGQPLWPDSTTEIPMESDTIMANRASCAIYATVFPMDRTFSGKFSQSARPSRARI